MAAHSHCYPGGNTKAVNSATELTQVSLQLGSRNYVRSPVNVKAFPSKFTDCKTNSNTETQQSINQKLANLIFVIGTMTIIPFPFFLQNYH